MKAGFLFLATFAATIGIGAIFMQATRAAEPVDIFVPPVPATPPGTNAAILPPGTYHAVRQDGVKLSGLIHSPDVSKFPMLSRQPRTTGPQSNMPKKQPGLRFVPVEPQPQVLTLTRPAP